MENSTMQPEDELSCIWKLEETQNPHKSLDHKYWKKIFIVSCLCALLVDPLFLYIPILKDDIKCLMLDQKLKITVLILRSVTDFFYLLDITIQIYRHENYSSEELSDNQNQMKCGFLWKSRVPKIAKTIWMSHDILIDIVAVLPFPQVAILIFFAKMSDLTSLTTTRMVIMNVFALLQYVPRVLRIYRSVKKFKRILKEEITETPIWIKGVLNFSMYIIASHVFGAVWYFFAIQRMMICWHSACRKDDGCDHRIFSCHDHHAFRNATILDDLCPVNVSVSVSPSDIMPFDFGIFATVLQSGLVGSTNYFQKFLTCFWWGLRNLSSLGSNLVPSIDGWETLYTVLISIIGLLMFLYLIGNLQMYMQFETTRKEDHKHRTQMRQKMKQKGQEIELWLFKNGIPTRSNKAMKLQFMEKVQQALEEYMDTNLDNILPILPSDVQSHIKNSMPLAKLKQVRMLQGMDEAVLKKICQKLEPVRYENDINIIQKNKPLEKMLFIVDGYVVIEKRSYDYDDSKRGAGEVCGEELLRWPFSTSFSDTKWLATESVKATGVVEALAIKACDLETIYKQSDISRIEAPRHRRMMKEEMEQNIDCWIPRNGIPERLNKDVKSRIMETVQQQFHEDKDVYWDNLAFDWDNLLPLDFLNEIKSYMPLTRLKKMPTYQNMEELVLKEICRHLQPMKYFVGSIIETDPIQMTFIVEGKTAHEGSVKGAGEFYGEELLVWPFSTSFPDIVPTTAKCPKVLTDVLEVLVLTASDMKSVATEFRKHFMKNYGRLVQNLGNYVSMPAPSSSEAVVKLFTEEELKEATENYSCYNYVNEGGYGTVYEGILHRTRVAIKRCNSTNVDQYIQSRRLVYEAFVLSQIRHKNVVRLLGCCLETKWPLMVYDRTYSWTLYELIHIHKPKLSLESRMKIAAETAGALAYLHSRSVIHRDVKTANIVIDHTTYNTKVSGFRASRLLNEDQDEMEDDSNLPGISGYLDPEYLKSNVLTEKSDVYSFGIVLVELLCQKPVSSDGSERSLANVFVSSVKQSRLGQILNGKIIKDEFTFEIAKKVSELAVTCLRSRGEERPSMEEVAVELERVVQTIINSVEYDKRIKTSIFLRRVKPSAVDDDNISTASSTSE